MSESVGKISLDLEVKSDINQQVSDISGQIGKSLKSSLDGGLKSAFEGINNSTKSSVSNLSRVIDKSMSGMSKGLKQRLGSIFSSFQQIKAPTVQFPQPQNSPMPQVSVPQAQPVRGPPQINTEAIRAQIDTLGRTLDNTNARIEQQNTKLKLLREQYSATFNQNRKNKLSEQILKTEANINRLTATSDKLGFKLSDLDSKLSQTSGASGKVANGMNAINQSTKKATTSARLFGDRMKKNTQQMGSYRSGIGMMVRSMITWGMVFPMIIRGLSALGTYIGQSFMTNQRFANSLAQIKTNLMVAFTPIFQAVLPALNALMSALATATTYIASFISAIFGKTYQQSYQATQGLIDAKTAMGAYGDSASNAAKKVKGALAGFDEINSLNIQDDVSSTGGTGGSSAPTLVQPSVDTSLIDSQTKSIVDKINEFFKGIDFVPLKNSFIELKAAITPIIKNIGKIISWFMKNILQPLSEWVIEDALPAFFNVLAGVFKVLNPLLEVFMDLGSWLWESFLEPIATWTGGVIVSVLNELADTLSAIGTWMSENKPIVEAFVIIIGSFALAWGLVSAALAIVSAVTGIWAAAATIGTVATTLFGAAIAFLTSPITIAILAIGAIIAAAILLWRNWDEVSAWLIELWETIKTKALEIWTRIREFLSETWEKIKTTCSEVWTNVKEFFVSIWNTIKEIASNVWTGILNTCQTIFNNLKNYMGDIWDGIKQIFSGVIDFVVGVFTGDWERAWEGVKSVFKGIFDTFESIVKTPINAIIGMINKVIGGFNSLSISIPDWAPGGLGGKTFGMNIPTIPKLAKGGVLDSPTLAMVGEAGKEAVVPLENNTQGLDLLANKLLERMPQSGGSDNSMNGDLILMIDGSVIGKVALSQLRKMQRQGGITLIPT